MLRDKAFNVCSNVLSILSLILKSKDAFHVTLTAKSVSMIQKSSVELAEKVSARIKLKSSLMVKL